ncbi:MAG: ABC transporter ATP-binding protein, partial [Planctomycetota bacterium]|nr:ABC transporter ATP-binding protein [Planctomycetota bacterium]
MASEFSLMSEQLAIQFQDLSFCYGDRQALKRVSFDVQCGELFSLLGPNGSGKTTLFRLLSTLISVQQGRLRVFNHDVQSEADAVRHDLGVVFQAPSLDGKLTAYENLAVQAVLYGLSKGEAQGRISEVSEQLGIADRLQDRTEKLSGGLRRRVELAKSLLHRPRLLIMDEPTSGLDPSARSDVWNYIRQLQESAGMTVFMTTHLLEEAD